MTRTNGLRFDQLTPSQQELASENVRLAWKIAAEWARKLYKVGIPLSDITSAAHYGIVKAAGYYDPSQGVKFTTYLGKCVDNEILQLVRKYNNRMKKDVLISTLTGTTGEDELSFGETLDYFVPPTEDSRVGLMREFLVAAMEDLDWRERRIIEIRFFENPNATQREIMAEIPVSQSYISRLETSALKKMRRYLEKNDIGMEWDDVYLRNA